MKVPDYLLKHLTDPKYQDSESGLILPGDDRLQHDVQSWDGGWDAVIREVSARDGIAWFPDSNVVISNECEPVWDAFRAAALGSSRTFISGAVWTEIQEWLNDPHHNERLARLIRESLEREGWARVYVPDASMEYAIHPYARLLGLRRLLCLDYTDDGRTIVGTDPKNAGETMDAVIKRFGGRAIALAKKGRKDAEAGKPINILDEYHCMTAIAHGILTGLETVILTRDADCLEIFRKAQWFMNTHYRAWAAASKVRDGYYGEPVRELPVSETKGYFTGPLTVYARPTNRLPEALPEDYHPVRVHLMFVAPDGQVLRMGSQFEREMRGMLETRAKTDRCTELFENRNIHIQLGPIDSGPERWHIGIGEDAVQIYKTDGVEFPLSELDTVHAIHNLERIGKL